MADILNDLKCIERNTGWAASTYESINTLWNENLIIVTPIHVSRVLEMPQKVPVIDIAHCTYFGWMQHMGQREDRTHNGFTADLSRRLRTGGYDQAPYSEEYLRFTSMPNEPGVFVAKVNFPSEDVSVTQRFEFLTAGSDVTARMTQTRSDKPLLKHIVDFRCTRN